MTEQKIWKGPETGWGEFQDYFEERYSELVGNVQETGPDRNDNASETASKQTIAYIEAQGYTVVE